MTNEVSKDQEPVRIGVYVCHCGRNIAGMVDVEDVTSYAGTLPYVALSKSYKYMCSAPGQELIQDDIKQHNLNRIVVASCSPLLHETTFRNATSAGGLNPFYMHMVSIREHVSWVHEDPQAATVKAKDIIRAAVGRVRFHKALERKKVPINPDVMVVGAGIAGIHAAITMADSGKKVYLVEREPSIGGHMAQFDKTFPTLDCAACILTPKMMTVNEHPNIELLSYSEVEDVSGYVGNFTIKVKNKARYIDTDKCTGCGDCYENCPVRNQTVIPPPRPIPLLPAEIKGFVDDVLGRHNGNARASLLPILQSINKEYRYLPKEVLQYVSIQLDVPLSSVLRVATFYNVFSLKPRGRHTVSVCLGTACFVKGSGLLLDKLKRDLEVEEGETTTDKRFTLEAVRCIGCCALAPAVRIDDHVHAHVNQNQIPRILKRYE